MFENGFPKDWSTLKKLIWLKTNALAGGLRTITGAIVSFLASKVTPITSLVVNIEPQQDTHGLDPYPAGGSNNLIPDGTDTSNGYVNNYYLKNDGTTSSSSDYYISEYFPVTAGETYTWSSLGNPNAPSICFYDENKSYISSVQAAQALPKTFTAPTGALLQSIAIKNRESLSG